MKYTLIILLALFSFGCRERCTCTGVEPILGEAICEGVLKHCTDDLTIKIEAKQFGRPGDKYLSVYFEAEAAGKDGPIDPAYGYGRFEPYYAHPNLIPTGKGIVYIGGYTGVTFNVIDFGTWIPKNEMLDYGVPKEFMTDRHFNAGDL